MLKKIFCLKNISKIYVVAQYLDLKTEFISNQFLLRLQLLGSCNVAIKTISSLKYVWKMLIKLIKHFHCMVGFLIMKYYSPDSLSVSVPMNKSMTQWIERIQFIEFQNSGPYHWATYYLLKLCFIGCFLIILFID